MDGNYDDEFSKIALCVTAAQLAKSTAVKDEGIGEDLTMNFFGWVGGELAIVCQMRSELMKWPIEARLEKCAQLCSVLRRYWWTTSISMVAEGYYSSNQKKTKNKELSTVFLDPNGAVGECVTVTHVSNDEPIKSGGKIDLTMVAVPYKYTLGRGVEWGEMIVYPQGPDAHLRNPKFPTMLKRALSEKMVDDLPPESYDELRILIKSNGFHLQEF